MSLRNYSIKAKSHILSLLGAELIGSDSLAIFELVKNAYDADAENVTIEFRNLNKINQTIIIEDDGHGMTPDIIEKHWLTIGTDFKRGENRIPSPLYKRASLGNKGVGRLAVHKLAESITVETQAKRQNFSSRFSIEWKKLINSGEFIQDLAIEVETIPDSGFSKHHGTRIILSGLITQNWTKNSVRDLARKIENIKNPFAEIPNFRIHIKLDSENTHWIDDIKTSTDILKDSLYKFEFELGKWVSALLDKPNTQDKAEFLWSYKFNPRKTMKIADLPIRDRHIERREHNRKKDDENVLLIGDAFNEIDPKDRNSFLLNADLDNIGPISGKFFVFNLAREVFNEYFGGQVNAVKEFIKLNYGIKIFRDNIRVYNYGEPLDDWLDLDLSKIQRSGDHFARKVTIGAVQLNLKESEKGLVEKTNREGLDENYYYKKFQIIVHTIFEFFETQTAPDKAMVAEYIEKLKPIRKVGLAETIKELSEKIKDKNLEKDLDPYIKRIEKDYNEMRDIMVNSGMTGLNLGIVFHEVDREIRFINTDLGQEKVDLDNIKGRVQNLILIIENFSPLLKQNRNSEATASSIAERVRKMSLRRMDFHRIIFSSPLLSGENKDFRIRGPINLIINALSNMMDNSIFWVKTQRDRSPTDFKPAIYIGSDLNTFEGPAIVIADNGTGFSLEPEELVQPFKTTRPGGMGLGLYYSNLVLGMIGGRLLFPDPADLDIPKGYTGACIALVFTKNQ